MTCSQETVGLTEETFFQNVNAAITRICHFKEKIQTLLNMFTLKSTGSVLLPRVEQKSTIKRGNIFPHTLS